MRSVTVEVEIDAPQTVVWSVISDIEGSASTISGIDAVEVLERPEPGIRGLKWRETRTMHGKRAVETMWITDVDEGSGYTTEARSHGSIYRTRIDLTEGARDSRLEMRFSAEPVTLAARLLMLVFGRLVARAVRGALLQDLLDVKAAAERLHRSSAEPTTPTPEAR